MANDRYLVLAGKEQEVLYSSDWDDICLEWMADHGNLVGKRDWEIFHQFEGVYPFDQNVDSDHSWVKMGEIPLEVAVDWLNRLQYQDPYELHKEGRKFSTGSFPNKHYFRVGVHYNLSLYFHDFSVWVIADLKTLHVR